MVNFIHNFFLDDALCELVQKCYSTKKKDVWEEIDGNKTSAWKECELCEYWFFKDVEFKFEEPVCNRCHDLLTMAHSLKNIAWLSAKGATFRCLLLGASKKLSVKKIK